MVHTEKSVADVLALLDEWLSDTVPLFVVQPLRDALTWRPIATAPRDGSDILTDQGVARWESDKYAKTPRPYWVRATFGVPRVLEDRNRQPTVWLPLPPKPLSDGAP